jgi:hypothetical protein
MPCAAKLSTTHEPAYLSDSTLPMPQDFRAAQNSRQTSVGENAGRRSRTRSTTTRSGSRCATATVMLSDEPPLGSTNPK